MSQTTESLMTLQEVSERLHIHPNTLRRWTVLGIIKTYRIGPRGDRRFEEGDIKAYLRRLVEKN